MSDGSSYLSTLILECDVGHAVCLILDIDQDLLVQHQRTDNPTNTHSFSLNSEHWEGEARLTPLPHPSSLRGLGSSRLAWPDALGEQGSAFPRAMVRYPFCSQLPNSHSPHTGPSSVLHIRRQSNSQSRSGLTSTSSPVTDSTRARYQARSKEN